MKKALTLAQKAAKQGEVPIGAVLVYKNELIASGYNKKEQWKTPLGHAELICLHRASQKLGNWRLIDCTLYSTLEPCVMCSGALVQARVGRLVFGASDPKGGGSTSLYKIPQDERLNHRLEVCGGVLADECGKILSDFFRSRR